MPRKSKSTSDAQSHPNHSEKDPQPTLTDEPSSTDKAAPNGRGAGGQFTKGNTGGPGNPHARACAKMLEVFRNAISQDEMLQICRMLYVKVVGGDVSAAKIILSYKIGKPLPAPHPDAIDRDEWDHYQNDAVREEEMKLVLSSLPTHSGNDIARASLPIMTAARMNDLAAQLLDGLPPRGDAEKGDEREEKGDKTNTKETPLSNGKNGGGKKIERAATTETPLPNGKSGKKLTPPDMFHQSQSATGEPLANGNSGNAAGGRNGRNKAKNQWMQPLAKRLKKRAKKEEAAV
jgi:hypothetical protein